MIRGALLFVVIGACGGGGGDPELDGTWKMDECASGGVSLVVVDGKDVEFTHSYFSVDGKCDGAPYAVRKDVERYAMGNASASAADAIEIDVTTIEGTLMVTAQATADNYNQIQYCGYTDWAANVPKDILGRTCTNGSNSVTYWARGDIYYDIYKVDGAKLFFGDATSGNGQSAATRPMRLETQFWSR